MPVYKVGVDIYDIPEDKMTEFESQYPDATQEYHVDGDIYDIPLGMRKDFEAQYMTQPVDKSQYTFTGEQLGIEGAPNIQFTKEAWDATQARLPKVSTKVLTPETATKEEVLDFLKEKDPLKFASNERGIEQLAQSVGDAGHKEKRRRYEEGLNHIERARLDAYITPKANSKLNIPVDIPEQFKYDYDFKKAFGYFPAGTEEELWRFLQTNAGKAYHQEMFGRVLSNAEIAKLQEDKNRLGFWGTVGQGFEQMGHGLKGVELEIAEGIADVFDVDHAKRNINKEREELLIKQANYKPTAEGFGGFVAEMIPQMAGTAAGILVSTFSPAAGGAIMKASTAGLIGSSMGSAALEARRYGAGDGQTAAAMIADGAIEMVTERIPLGEYIKRISPIKKLAGSAIKEVSEEALEKETKSLLEKARKQLGGKFTATTAKEFVKDITREGGSEIAAEALQTLVPIIYQNPEDYPTYTEVLNNAIEGAKGGFFMGAVFGAGTSAIQRRNNNQRRKAQGFVDVALAEIDKKPVVVEVLGKDASGKIVVLKDNKPIAVDEGQIKEREQYDYNEFRSNEVIFEQEQARDEGYSQEPTGGNALVVANEYTNARGEVVRALGLAEDDDVDAFIGDRKPEEIAQGDEDAEMAITHYLQTRARRDGFRERYQEERDRQFEESDKSIDGRSNNGSVYTTTLEGQPVYITGGNVALNEDGTIDVNNSSEALFVKFPDGFVFSKSPDKFTDKVTVENADELKVAGRAAIEEKWKAEFDNAENAYIEQQKRAEGSLFDMTDEKGTHRVEVIKEGKDFSNILLDGVPQKMSTDELNSWKQEAGIQSTENGVQSTDVVADNAMDNNAPTVAPTQVPIPTEKRGKEEREAFHLVPVERTMEELYTRGLEQQEIDDFVNANIDEINSDIAKHNKAVPKMGASITAYQAAKEEWRKKNDDLKKRLDYYTALQQQVAEATRSQMKENYDNTQPRDVVEMTPDEFIAEHLPRITPASFKSETGLSNSEQAGLVGYIAGKDKGGMTVEEAAESILENYDSELRGLGFTGDMQDVRNTIIDILSSGNPRSYAKRGLEQRNQESIDQQRAEIETVAAQLGFSSVEEMAEYESVVVPRIVETYKGFDENEYYNNLAENYGNDTTRESESIGQGSELLQGEQAADNNGAPTAGVGNQGGAVSNNMQGGGQNGTPQGNQQVNEPVGNSEQLSSSEIPNNQSVAEGNAPGNGSVLLSDEVANAEAEVNTTPTDAQKEAGNYKKGHVKIGPFNISIEQPKGSVRSGVDKDGKKWEVEMQNTYGYFRGTEGVDGDHIDVFLSNDIDGWNGRQVFVVDQRNADGSFDEHKVMLGFNDINDAEAAYMSNYEEGWQGLGAITGVSIEEFENWIASSHRKTKAFAEYKNVKTDEGQSTSAESGVEDIQEPRSVEDKDVSVATEDERGIYLAEIKALQERLKAFAQKSPGPRSFVEAYTANDAELIKRLDKQFNDALQTLVPLDIPAIEDTIKGMKDNKSIIKAGSANERKETPDYKAFDHIEKAVAKRKKQLEKELTEDDKRRIDIIKRGNRGELKETAQPKQENKPVESEPIKDETPVTSEATEQPETGEVADAGPVNRETLRLNMSEEDFNALLNSGDKAAVSEYLAEMDGLLRIGVGSPLDGRDAIVKEYRGLVEQYGGEGNIPADVVAGINERIAPYNALQRAVFDRKYDLQDKLREIETNEAQAKEQAEKEAKAKHKQTAFGGFLAGKTDLGASAAEKALSKKYNFDGKVMTVAEFVEDAVGNGNVKLSAIEEPKYKGASRAAWNRMDARQQEADAKRVKESGTKTVYTVNDHDLGKTAYDYAKFLLDKKVEQEKAAAKQKVKDAIEPFAKEKAAEQAPIKIEDVGEKIGGARKDIIRQYADKIKLDGKTFSTMFPKPDIDKLIEAGLPVDKVAAVKAMYDNAKREFEIMKKRRGKGKALQASLFYAMYAKNVLTGEEGNFDLAYNGYVFTEWGKEFMKANIELYKAVFNKLGADYGKVDLRSYFITPLAAGMRENFNLKKLNEENSRMQQRMAEMDGRKVPEYKDGDLINFVGEHYSRPSDQFETLEEAVNTMLERIGKEVKVGEAVQYKVESYWKRDAQGRADYTKAYLGIKVRGFGTVDVMEFKNMNEARAWLQDHREDFQQMAAAKEEQVKAEKKKPLPKYVLGHSYNEAQSQYSVFADFGKEGVRILKTFDIPQAEGVAAQAKVRSEVYKNEVLPYINSEEAVQSADGIAQEIRDAKNAKPKSITIEKKSRERVGVDWRNGKDATPEMFVDVEGKEPSVFGFRAIEFGNYVSQKERQQFLNDIYDALMDMSEILGVSPRALSLGGKLALAVGARGTSGASGHYEPYKNVINITKTRGAGVLAHEWLHALDRYFSNFDENMVYPNGTRYATQQEYADDTRQEVKDAFEKVMLAVKASDYRDRSMRLGEYWASEKELAARALQDYVIRKLEERGRKNDFLSNHVSPEEWDGDAKDYPFPLGEDVVYIGDAFDNFFATLQEKTVDGQTVLYSIGEDYLLEEKETEAFKRATKTTKEAVERLKANGLEVEIRDNADDIPDNAEPQTSKEIEGKYPNWLEGTTTDSGKHSTQVEGTRKTYKKIGDWIEENLGKDVAILDASSGMGYGTADLRERGFNIEDVEPYQSEERKQNNPAIYSSYGDIDKQYDYIISNAVLNVIPDDWRAGVLHDMADRLKSGGKIFINTRKAGEEKSIKDKIELDSPQEVLVKRNGRIASYQRFFTPQELKEWVESELGDGYTVEVANKTNSGTNGLAAVVVTKNTGSPAKGKTSGKFVGRTELSTSDGKVYGWAVDGKIYLTPDGINPNTPVHEYTHLWVAAVEQRNPELWAEIKEAMKLTPVWNEVMSDGNYSNIWNNENRVASEVLSRLTGRENYRRTMEQAKKEIEQAKTIEEKAEKISRRAKIKAALKNFWNWVQRNVFRKKENATAKATTEVMPWEEFVNSVVGDFYKGKNPNVKESPLEGMFVGEKGAANLDKAEEATTRLDNLAVAREMKNAGKEAKAIKLATGWERGADGKWRYETEDAKFKENWDDKLEGDGVKLTEVLDDDALFKAYPELKDVVIKYDEKTMSLAYYDSEENLIGVNPFNLRDHRSSIIHEIQHAVQEIECFARGSNVERFADVRGAVLDSLNFMTNGDLLKGSAISDVQSLRDALDKNIPYTEVSVKEGYAENLQKVARKYGYENIDALVEDFTNMPSAFEQYRRTAGEVESRNVQERMNMSAEERRASLAAETEDVARKDQIFIYDALESAMMGSRVDARMAEVAAHFEGKQLTAEQQAVVDVFGGKADNLTISVKTKEGNERRVVMRQGNEMGAGAKHSLFRHFGTGVGVITSDDIISIPDVIANGVRTEKQRGNTRLAEYKLTDRNGDEFTVLTEIKKGKEIFNDFYSNKKAPLSGTFNTQSAHTANNNALSADKGSDNSSNTQEGEARFRTVEETTDGSIDDVPAQPLTLMERITNSLLEVSAKNKENLGLRADALRAFGRDINRVLSLMKAQKEYDKSTVDTLVKLAKMYFKNAQLLGEVTPYEMGRILSVINNVVGKRDVTASAAKLMDILLDAHTKALAGILDKAEKVKAKKVNAAGVEVMGRLDKYGQKTIESYKAGKNREMKDLADSINESDNRIAELEEKVRKALGLKDDDDLEKAVDEYTGSEKAVDDYKTERARNEGLNLAMEYKEKVQLTQNEVEDLKQELKSAERDLEGDARREAVKAIQDSIMKSKVDLIDAYHGLIYKLSAGTSEAAKRAKEFRQAQIDRAREIQHNANSDLEGIPADAQGVYPNKYNNAVTRGLMSPMITLQGMLKKFGEKAVDSKGYLYNRFMPQLTNASHNEFVGKVNARVLINIELQRIFGKEMNIDGFNRLSREDGFTISYMEAGRQKEFALNKGQMLYIYMVNKMSDGQMKLRKMGITEELVNEIAGKLDPKMIQFADWVQGTLLKDLRSKYNAVHERMFGAPMAEIEEYFPLKIRKEARGERVEAGQPGYEGKPSTVTGAIIKRTKNAIALDLSADAMSVLIEHIDDMEHWAAFAEFNRDINTLINYRHFQNQVKNMTSIRYGSGKEMWDNFRDVVDIATKTYRPSDKKADKYVLNLMKGLTAKNITFKGYTALKQFLSAPGFWNEAGVKELYDAYTSPRESIKWALQNLPGVKERWEGRTVGNEKLLPNESDWEIWRNKFVAGATRWGMTPNAAIDLLTVATGARAVYMTKLKKYKNAGYSEQRAHEKALQDAAEAYNETQQSSEGAYLSPLQTDGTVLSAILTTYKNNSFGYTRKTAQAIANINKKREPGYKKKSIAFMTKQMMRDGLSEEQAKRFAEKMYNRSMYKDAADIALFGFGLGILWELGNSAIYLLLGDDEEEKEKLLSDALYEGGLSFFDGIPLGETLVGAGRAIKEGDVKYFKLPQLVGAGDIEQIAKTLEYEPVKGATDLLNALIAARIGVNPQTFTNMYAALADGGPGGVEMSVLAFLNAPNSQLEKLMVDKGMENSAINAEEIMLRYANYMLNRNTPITQLLYSDKAEQEAVERYGKRFAKLLDERLENVVEDTGTFDLFYNDTDAEMKKVLASMRKKHLAGDEADKFQKVSTKTILTNLLEGKDIDNVGYYKLTNADDVDEGFVVEMQIKELKDISDELKKLKDAGDKDAAIGYKNKHSKELKLYKKLNKYQNDINEFKSKMKKKPENAERYMAKIRRLRAKAIELINNYRNNE